MRPDPASTLFIVPCDAAGTASGVAWASAPSSASAMRWEVSTLPAATAAGGSALTIEPAGDDMVIDRQHPPLAGMDGSVATRTA